MKFNLKNRPSGLDYMKIIDSQGEMNWKGLALAYKEWFEGFEKELRERIKGIVYGENPDPLELLKEILGE